MQSRTFYFIYIVCTKIIQYYFYYLYFINPEKKNKFKIYIVSLFSPWLKNLFQPHLCKSVIFDEKFEISQRCKNY